MKRSKMQTCEAGPHGIRLERAFALVFALVTVFLRAQTESSRTPGNSGRWHFQDASSRVLIRLAIAPTRRAPLGRPFAAPLSTLNIPDGPPKEAGKGMRFRAWDVEADQECLCQQCGDAVLLGAGRPLPPGGLRLFYLYVVPCAPGATAGASAGTPAVRMSDAGRVVARTYTADIDVAHGGIIRSLRLRRGKRLVETLGDGIHWWVGREPRITQESFGHVNIEYGPSGPLFCEARITYPDVLTPGNTLTAVYRFFGDFVELDYHYHVVKPVSLTWFKLPVSLAAVGPTPGVYSNSRGTDQPLKTAGKSNVWTSDLYWHDVSYGAPHEFGIGVIARNRLGGGGLWFMDSVREKEYEWVYAEPFGWQSPVRVSADFDVCLTVVPHAPGPGRRRDTVAKVKSGVRVAVSAPQRRGGPPIDSDRDGLPDLDEYRLNTNPRAGDTDLDGVPDGRDRDPLAGLPPEDEPELPRFSPVETTRRVTRAEIKRVGGVPTMVLDGRPVGPMCYTRGAASYPQLRQLGDCGFRVYFEYVGSIGWPGRQQQFFRRLDERIERFLDEVPNARIILRLYVCNPPHFARDYPDEVMRFNDGSVRHFTKWYAMKDRPLEERGYPSFASEVWRRGTAQALYNVVEHVLRADYAPNVIGYFICGGGTEEWYYWGDYDHRRYCVDFSKPMLRAFRRYLRRKYAGDVRRLRAAWNDPEADFATALPPGPDRFTPPATGVFWDPRRDQRIRDYYCVHNKVMEDSLRIFAHAVKQACGGRQLVGMFHGYLQNHWLLEGGQATLKDLLNSPDVDFWSGPPQYNRRGPGEHACIRFLPATFKVHGKLWINESDIRTNFVPPDPKNPAIHGRPQTLEQTLGCLEREFAHLLCEGVNGWWFQMGPDWYHHPPILDLFRTLQQVGDAAVQLDRRSATDVAAVVDLESLFTGPAFPISSAVLDAFKVQELCRIGTPVDFYELDDLLAPHAPRYRMIIFLNCFSLTDRERRLIEQRLRRDGAMLVWMFAPGLFNPDRKPEMALAHSRDVLGFALDHRRGNALKLDMRLTTAGAAALRGFDPSRVFGGFERLEWALDPKTGGVRRVPARPFTVRERFIGPDGPDLPASIRILARFSDSGEPSMVMRTSKHATDVWIGSVVAPAALLRALAGRAGCHLYCDADEIVYANRSFLAVHTAASGERTFHLRRPTDVIDVLDGRVLGRQVSAFTDDIPAYHTRLYALVSEKEWRLRMAWAGAEFARFREALAAGRKARAARPKIPAVPPARLLKEAGPFRVTEDGMVRTFLVCGPFPSPGAGENAKGFETAFIDECNIRPAPGSVTVAEFHAGPGSPEAVAWFGNPKGGVKHVRNAWTACRTSSDLAYLEEQLPRITPHRSVAYYVALYVEPEAAGPVRIGIGSDDGFKLWVNGKYIAGKNVTRSLGIETDRYAVDLNNGRNLILLKIVQGGGPTGWSLRLCDPAGNPLRNARLWLAP